MQQFWSLEEIQLNDSWLTIGSFDGVHRGHQEIIRSLTAGAHAEGSPAVVLTFYPHPSVVLGKRKDPFYLTSVEEQAELLGELGVDYVITHPFSLEVSQITARDFVASLSKRLGLRHLWVGYDFALGRGREGNVSLLGELGKEFGYSLHLVEPVKVNGEVISSSQIRAALRDGEVEQAASLLGRPYQIAGEVIPGDGRGRSLGIPTANLQVWKERALPKAGVYACQARVRGETWGAVTNVGVRPTFENQPVSPRVETHLLDFDRDLYGEQVKLSFLARLRDEQRFSNVQALVDQIHQDIHRARKILSSSASDSPTI